MGECGRVHSIKAGKSVYEALKQKSVTYLKFADSHFQFPIYLFMVKKDTIEDWSEMFLAFSHIECL